ncbi:helix-turn-helix transcriptional regulator [Isoptericola variabilis]|uniref:Helix-turn-helix domain protein n=1 Tax=Isoptericola variabilis (strain 225) TaxID=743718 RepID=F6FPF9_ISOV2|nr:helix-turn-helix transcriptional regulator [Isoptericola variabilis]AEG43672.1 helix-turn-helix domain protein [Isoptericola variabilis 225]
MAISTSRDLGTREPRRPTPPAAGAAAPSIPLEAEPDALTIGRRIRHLRTQRGMTLEDLATAIGRAPSQVSMLENGRREPTFSRLQAVARALDASVEDLLSPEPPSRRDALEIELERVQRGPLFSVLGIRPVRVGKSLPTDALEAIVALQRELERLHRERAATPEEARRANTELRADMRAQDNYFPDLEIAARGLLDDVGHTRGPLPQRAAGELAAHLGFTIHYVPDVPHSVRAVIDQRHRRVYLPSNGIRGRSDARSALLQALASHVLEHAEPRDYREFLRQRVEANYLCAALLVPERDAVKHLREAKEARAISLEDLRDAFAVSYETAAHRFTNLATRHLGIGVHFMKVHESGAIHKAYENDGVRFPADALGTVEGQYVCRHWTARVVFGIEDRLSPYYQYTDTPTGTYWCTSRVSDTPEGRFSVSVGVPFSQVKWFLGRETTARATSRCPDESCCRQPAEPLRQRWAGHAFPSARPHASMLAAMPSGAFPGVDTTEVYEFLERHAPSS